MTKVSPEIKREQNRRYREKKKQEKEEYLRLLEESKGKIEVVESDNEDVESVKKSEINEIEVMSEEAERIQEDEEIENTVTLDLETWNELLKYAQKGYQMEEMEQNPVKEDNHVVESKPMSNNENNFFLTLLKQTAMTAVPQLFLSTIHYVGPVLAEHSKKRPSMTNVRPVPRPSAEPQVYATYDAPL